ncbi:hypothetical protein CC1G_04901 [Coprinopsis cinerea okayama7|uniref:Uncharacterized protein n=1 Tax=Coprinopsis cinerea (strain Okayama-7 / 130 / ATCC MYA-4618 / FGSC 9003) TaxID=240176 RepID=A8PFG3_COPC7|nr:hypothetical protein CC1G_04901 [Coprinopsis cinerea okayama7\|eukprot:XP_001841057.1 hypothetical protein CC1G_04901 [Coprinopsis cinerea okayama7\
MFNTDVPPTPGRTDFPITGDAVDPFHRPVCARPPTKKEIQHKSPPRLPSEHTEELQFQGEVVHTLMMTTEVARVLAMLDAIMGPAEKCGLDPTRCGERSQGDVTHNLVSYGDQAQSFTLRVFGIDCTCSVCLRQWAKKASPKKSTSKNGLQGTLLDTQSVVSAMVDFLGIEVSNEDAGPSSKSFSQQWDRERVVNAMLWFLEPFVRYWLVADGEGSTEEYHDSDNDDTPIPPCTDEPDQLELNLGLRMQDLRLIFRTMYDFYAKGLSTKIMPLSLPIRLYRLHRQRIAMQARMELEKESEVQAKTGAARQEIATVSNQDAPMDTEAGSGVQGDDELEEGEIREDSVSTTSITTSEPAPDTMAPFPEGSFYDHFTSSTHAIALMFFQNRSHTGAETPPKLAIRSAAARAAMREREGRGGGMRGLTGKARETALEARVVKARLEDQERREAAQTLEGRKGQLTCRPKNSSPLRLSLTRDEAFALMDANERRWTKVDRLISLVYGDMRHELEEAQARYLVPGKGLHIDEPTSRLPMPLSDSNPCTTSPPVADPPTWPFSRDPLPKPALCSLAHNGNLMGYPARIPVTDSVAQILANAKALLLPHWSTFEADLKCSVDNIYTENPRLQEERDQCQVEKEKEAMEWRDPVFGPSIRDEVPPNDEEFEDIPTLSPRLKELERMIFRQTRLKVVSETGSSLSSNGNLFYQPSTLTA